MNVCALQRTGRSTLCGLWSCSCAVSLGSWPGGAWVPWRAGPWFFVVVVVVVVVASVLHLTYSVAEVSMFHLQNGLRPNSCRWLLFLRGFSFD